MFQQTRRQLVLWNAIVVFLVLTVFGIALLAQMRVRLYASLDSEMLGQVQPIVRAVKQGVVPPALLSDPGVSHNSPILRAPIGLLLWDASGQMITANPYEWPTDALANLRTLALQHQAGYVTADGHHLRILNLALQVPSTDGIAVVDLEILRNSDDISGTLQQLTWVVALCTVIGALLSILAGWLLATRALVPIRSAWEKQVQFVADASHEIRTPLMAIQANAELLLHQPEVTIADKAPTIAGILSETRRLKRLVTHLLTLARSDSHLTPLTRSSTDITALIQEVVQQFSPLCEAEGLTLNATTTDSVIAEVDEERIRQVCLILLDNALKYTDQGSITVSCHTAGRKLELSVIDTGCGIPPADISRVFDRFFRSDHARTGRTTSAGLGLSIAKWIVEAHHGTIHIQSTLDRGTRVDVTLPLK